MPDPGHIELREALNNCRIQLASQGVTIYWTEVNAAHLGALLAERDSLAALLEEARKCFEQIVHLILDPRLDAENARALIRIEASKGLKVTE